MKISKMTLVKVLILISTFITVEVSVGQPTANRTNDIQAAFPQIDKIFRNYTDSNHLPGIIYWNNAAATGIFADNFFMDYFPDSLRKKQDHI